MAYSTGTALLAIADTFTETDTIARERALIWINEFLIYKLGKDAMIMKSMEYPNSVQDEEYPLPDDFNGVYAVEKYDSTRMVPANKLRRCFNYGMEESVITFPYDGNYKLKYFVLPQTISGLNETIQIDPVFYFPLELWVAYRFLTWDDEDEVTSQSLGDRRLAEYQAMMQNAIKERRKKFREKKHIHLQ